MPWINKQIIQTGGGSSTPWGADTQVQFNDGWSFWWDARFYFDPSTWGVTWGSFEVEAWTSVDWYWWALFTEWGQEWSGGSVQAFAWNAITSGSNGGHLYFGSGSWNWTWNWWKVRFQAWDSPSWVGGNIEFQVGDWPTPWKYLFKTANTNYSWELNVESITANRIYTFPNASWTLALTSDIPAWVLKLPTYTVGATWADYPWFTDTAIQAALDAWNGKIYLTDGTYVLSTGLKFKSNYQYIIGNGEKCIIQFNGATVPTAISPNATNLKQWGIKGVSIRQTNATVQGTALDLSDMAIMDIDVEIKDAGVAVKMNDANNNTFYNRVYVKAFGCARGIEMNGANPSNHNYFSGRIANKSGWDYGIYIVKWQGNHFEDMSLEPVATTGNTGIYLTSASAYSNTFENMWIEGNNVWVTIDSSVTYNTFIGGTITSNTTNFTNNGKNTSVINTQIWSNGTTILQPFTATDTGNASSVVETITNNTSFAHVSSKLVSYELKNATDSSKVLEIKNAGTWNSISVMQWASEVMSVEENWKTNVSSLKIGSSSTTWYVWTATDTSWNGSWQASSWWSWLTHAQVKRRTSLSF